MFRLPIHIKRLLTATLLLVVFAQTAVYVHEMEHLFSHEQSDCPICLTADHQPAIESDITGIATLHPRTNAVASLLILGDVFRSQHYSPRAPPTA